MTAFPKKAPKSAQPRPLRPRIATLAAAWRLRFYSLLQDAVELRCMYVFPGGKREETVLVRVVCVQHGEGAPLSTHPLSPPRWILHLACVSAATHSRRDSVSVSSG